MYPLPKEQSFQSTDILKCIEQDKRRRWRTVFRLTAWKDRQFREVNWRCWVMSAVHFSKLIAIRTMAATMRKRIPRKPLCE